MSHLGTATLLLAGSCAAVVGACTSAKNVQCSEDAHCDLVGGGACLQAPSGNQWCAFPDGSCVSGQRWANLDVGDGLSGQCVGGDSPDAGTGPDGMAQCENHDDCMAADPTRPFCASDGRCGACLENTDCPTADAAVCDVSDLTCGACDTHADCAGSPFGERCSPGGACVACLDHGDCASEVCDRDLLACVPVGDIIHVDSTDGSDTAGCGSAGAPCRSIRFALTMVNATRRHLLLASGTYGENPSISGIDVSIIGPGATVLVLDLDFPIVTIEKGANVIIDGLRVTGAVGASGGHGIACSGIGTTVVLRRAEVSSSERHGIEISSCDVTVEESTILDNGERGISVVDGSIRVVRSRLEGNALGGLVVQDSGFHVENSVVVDNGTAGASGSNVGGIGIANLNPESPHALLYNTIAGNRAIDSANAFGVDCQNGGTSPTLVGNIVYFGSGPAAAVAGVSCEWEYSDIQNGPAGPGNLDVDPQFVNATGDYHLQPDSPLVDMGTTLPEVTDDFDGEPRNDGSYDIGADEVQGP